MDDTQHARLLAAHRAVEEAERAETAARAARNAYAAELLAAGYGGTELARVLNADPAPWRPVTRTTPYRWTDDRLGAPGGADKSRGLTLDGDQAEHLRALHRALYEAGRAVEDAEDARGDLFVALHAAGVPVLDQARALGVDRNTVQRPISRRRPPGARRRNRARA